MTKQERDIIKICYDVISRMVAKERRSWKKYHLQVTKSKLEHQLKEPIDEIEYAGDHIKLDNPFFES